MDQTLHKSNVLPGRSQLTYEAGIWFQHIIFTGGINHEWQVQTKYYPSNPGDDVDPQLSAVITGD